MSKSVIYGIFSCLLLFVLMVYSGYTYTHTQATYLIPIDWINGSLCVVCSLFVVLWKKELKKGEL